MEANSRPVDALSASQWRLGLPSFDDLTPLDQPLITPNLASAFGIMPTTCSTKCLKEAEHDMGSTDVELLQLFPEKSEGCSRVRRRDESGDSGGGGGSEECYSGGDESGSSGGRAVKRPRLVWTPHLHKRFVEVIDQLGVEKAVPKTIMEMMSVEGLTRENVASHLQKYRMYLKKAEVGGPGEVDSNPISSTTTGGSRDSSAFECGNGGFAGPMLPSGVDFKSIASMLPLPLLPLPSMVDDSVSFGYGGGPLGVAPASGGSGKAGYCGMESGGYNASMLWNRRGG